MKPLFPLLLATLTVFSTVVSLLGSPSARAFQREIMAVTQPIAKTISDVGSSQCSNVKTKLGLEYDQLVENEREPDLNRLTLEYRDSNIRIVFNLTTAAERIPLMPKFNSSQKLYIFIHGFTEDPSKTSFRTISQALLSQGNSNVLALDGSSLIRWMYVRSTTYVRFIGERLGQVLAAMVDRGIDPVAIHIIGHSLGAHISGFAGRTFNSLTGTRLGRISGLDPAGPCFSYGEPEIRLTLSDALFLDVIHTDIGVLGLKDAIGHVDYYPNGGAQQPNCLLQTCSHNRAWVYFAESVTTPEAFPAVRCRDYDAFRKGRCESNVSFMGFPSQPGTTGVFYLQTRGDSPYGLGKAGLTWRNNEGILRSIGRQIFG